MILHEEITEYVQALAAMPDHKIQVAEGALVIAKYQYPSLDQSKYLRLLDEMGDRLRSRMEDVTEHSQIIAEVNRMLFEEEGFKGDTLNYYDPRNSFLNQVLERKLGIPITLSIVYMEVGRRAGLPLYGIGLPGHFITGFLSAAGRIFIDPFNKGEILTEDVCRAMVRRSGRALQGFSPRFLDPVWPKQILVRLLRNLKASYWLQGLEMKALQVIEWVTILDPDSPAEYRERGFINQELGDFAKAAEDFDRYLSLSPDAEDSETIRDAIARLKTEKSTVH